MFGFTVRDFVESLIVVLILLLMWKFIIGLAVVAFVVGLTIALLGKIGLISINHEKRK